jgi:hypothetical protein
MVNPLQEVVEVHLRLYDKELNQIGDRVFYLEPGAHLARLIYELFPHSASQASEMEGVVTVTSSGPLATVTVRQNNDVDLVFPAEVPTLTTFPVIPGVPD